MISVAWLQEYYTGTAYADTDDIAQLTLLVNASVQRLNAVLNQPIGQKSTVLRLDRYVIFCRIPVLNVPFSVVSVVDSEGETVTQSETEGYVVEEYGGYRYMTFARAIRPTITYTSGYIADNCPENIKHVIGKLTMMEASKIGMVGQSAKLLREIPGTQQNTISDSELKEELSEYYWNSP